jgi:E3 ubiquitin-protein ligase UBR1
MSILSAYIEISPGPLRDPPSRHVSIFARFLPDWFRNNRLTSPLLLRDPLTIVIETAALCPDILQPVMVLAYHAELARTMLSMPFWAKKSLVELSRASKPSDQPSEDATSASAHTLFTGFRTVAMTMFRHSPQLHHEAASVLSVLTDGQISRLIYTFTLPFLRRCGIIKQVVGTTGFPPATAESDPTVCEYTRLLATLGIPPPRPSLTDPNSNTSLMISTWLQPWSTTPPSLLPSLEFPGIYELYRLPRSLEDILRAVIGRRCANCGREPSAMGICYICGEVVCLGLDCCAEGEMGECNLHRMR